MYAHPAFHVDRAASLAFAAARGFGLVVACAGDRPVASPLPFRLEYANDGTPRLMFHVARVNPLAELAAVGGTWLVSVMGADAYVSPDWYASPHQVPTWLYESAQLSGPVRLLSPGSLAAHLSDLSETFESRLAPKPVWTADKLPPGRHAALQRGIVGIELLVETVEGAFKLNQHKAEADQRAIANALAGRPDASSQAIAAHMRALQPHLHEDLAAAASASAVLQEA